MLDRKRSSAYAVRSQKNMRKIADNVLEMPEVRKQMNATATDAAIEELQQVVEIEEAGYRLVTVPSAAFGTGC